MAFANDCFLKNYQLVNFFEKEEQNNIVRVRRVFTIKNFK